MTKATNADNRHGDLGSILGLMTVYGGGPRHQFDDPRAFKGWTTSLDAPTWIHPKVQAQILNRYAEQPRIVTTNERLSSYDGLFDLVLINEETEENPVVRYSGVPLDLYRQRVLLHELAHSTGHPRRLNRSNWRNDQTSNRDYALEEVVAELTAMRLLEHLKLQTPGLTALQNSYIDKYGMKFAIHEGRSRAEVIAEAQPSVDEAVPYLLGLLTPSVPWKTRRNRIIELDEYELPQYLRGVQQNKVYESELVAA